MDKFRNRKWERKRELLHALKKNWYVHRATERKKNLTGPQWNSTKHKD